jgi:hypothetical protein
MANSKSNNRPRRKSLRITNSDDAQSLVLAMGGTPVDPQPPHIWIEIANVLGEVRKTPEYADLIRRCRAEKLTPIQTMRHIAKLCVEHVDAKHGERA